MLNSQHRQPWLLTLWALLGALFALCFLDFPFRLVFPFVLELPTEEADCALLRSSLSCASN